jgi:hypothetical protein
MSFKTLLTATAALSIAAPSFAQVAASTEATTTLASTAPAATASIAATPAPLAAPPAPAVAAILAPIKIVEGTEMSVRIEDRLTSKDANEGDRFTITLDDDVTLSDGTVLKAGYRGVGEIVEARRNGAMGRTGKLNIRLNYLKVGEQRIRLRGAKSAQGDHRTGTQVVTVVLVGVFAGFVKGKNTEIPKGTLVSAFVDQDVMLDRPVIAPPPAA